MKDHIDVHSHYLPPGYLETAMAALKGAPDGMPHMPQWHADTAIEMMDRQGITKAMLSVSSPGVYFGNDETAGTLARSINESQPEVHKTIPKGLAFSRACRCRMSNSPFRRSTTLFGCSRPTASSC